MTSDLVSVFCHHARLACSVNAEWLITEISDIFIKFLIRNNRFTDRILTKALKVQIVTYGKLHGSAPSLPIPMPLQIAAMRQTGLICSSFRLSFISRSSSSVLTAGSWEQRRRNACESSSFRLNRRLPPGLSCYWTQCSFSAFFNCLTVIHWLGGCPYCSHRGEKSI